MKQSADASLGATAPLDSDEAIRWLAIERVDSRYGYTMEFSATPDAHAREYDDEEHLIRSEFRSKP